MIKSIIIGMVSVLLFSCSSKKTIFGVYENKKGDQVTIDCNYRIYSKKLADQLLMPESGDKITLVAHEMNPVEFELTYQVNGIRSAFGSWNRESDELKIGIASFVKKEEVDCE